MQTSIIVWLALAALAHLIFITLLQARWINNQNSHVIGDEYLIYATLTHESPEIFEMLPQLSLIQPEETLQLCFSASTRLFLFLFNTWLCHIITWLHSCHALLCMIDSCLYLLSHPLLLQKSSASCKVSHSPVSVWWWWWWCHWRPFFDHLVSALWISVVLARAGKCTKSSMIVPIKRGSMHSNDY